MSFSQPTDQPTGQSTPHLLFATAQIPNLAGLARTCEIFGATELVLSDKKVQDDDMFQRISVTANKWVPLSYVGQPQLEAFLRRKKQEGFTVLALEQTAQSVCISQFTFPEKVVLLLGKEKEGVPVQFLQLVDHCIEIPQFGIIRSLNVHVSGAILIWEYTRQQMVRQTIGAAPTSTGLPEAADAQ